MDNVITYSIYAKLKQCKHHYITSNIDKQFATLLKELKQQLTDGNEITLSKLVGKDVVNLIKLLP